MKTSTKYRSGSIKKRWSFKFTIRCTHRMYELLAPSEDEQFLWIFTFRWIVNENRRIAAKKMEYKENADKLRELEK